jgi:hypothetical protein
MGIAVVNPFVQSHALVVAVVLEAISISRRHPSLPRATMMDPRSSGSGLSPTGRVLPCPRPVPTRGSSGSFLTAVRMNWSCSNHSRPRTAPGPTSCCRARPRRPRTALWSRRSSPPARMTMTGARRPAPRASLQPRSPDSAPGSPPRPSSRSLGKRSRWLRFVRAMSLKLLACLPPYRPVHVCVCVCVCG